tara:strand:+ start:8401 stop:8916 length:516 start_codon:yes stop_codon:yes gene_type:complete
MKLHRFDQMIRPEGRIFYGWRIVLASAGIQLIAGVLWMQSFGAYTVLLQREFGWSKAVVSGAFALTRVESGLLGPLQGWLVDHYGPRAILRIGLILFGLGFMLFSQVNSVLTIGVRIQLIPNTITGDYPKDRQPDDLHIKPHRSMLCIVNIMLNFLWNRQIIPTTNLSPTC